MALAVGMLVASSEKCVAKCRKAEAAGKVPAGACVYLVGSDPKTIDCLIKVGDKALDLLEDPELDAPECLAPALELALGMIEELDPRVFCPSARGTSLE